MDRSSEILKWPYFIFLWGARYVQLISFQFSSLKQNSSIWREKCWRWEISRNNHKTWEFEIWWCRYPWYWQWFCQNASRNCNEKNNFPLPSTQTPQNQALSLTIIEGLMDYCTELSDIMNLHSSAPRFRWCFVLWFSSGEYVVFQSCFQ